MRQQRTRLIISVGNLLETVGAAAVVYGVDRLAGLAWALVLAGVLAVFAAELIYSAHVWRVSLPRRPQPRRRVEEGRQRFELWRARRAVAWHAWRSRA